MSAETNNVKVLILYSKQQAFKNQYYSSSEQQKIQVKTTKDSAMIAVLFRVTICKESIIINKILCVLTKYIGCAHYEH